MERFANTSMGFFYERDKGAVSFYFRVFIEAISNMYNILWDIYIDGSLLRKNNFSNNRLLFCYDLRCTYKGFLDLVLYTLKGFIS